MGHVRVRPDNSVAATAHVSTARARPPADRIAQSARPQLMAPLPAKTESAISPARQGFIAVAIPAPTTPVSILAHRAASLVQSHQTQSRQPATATSAGPPVKRGLAPAAYPVIGALSII